MEINFYNVEFKYDKLHETLNNVNLTINKKGEFITILGHTGSGKSTLVQLMNALLLPNKGEIKVFDQIIKPKKNKDLKNIRKKIGLVFQFPEYQLFEDTVLKDIMFGPKNFGLKENVAKEKALEVIKDLNISEELLNRPPFNLSGGQKRKVAIAGILASDPDVLILDEPTVGLDPKGRLELLELLKNIYITKQKTIILITHDMNVVANYATRSIVLNNGNIVFDGTPKEMFNDLTKLKEMNLELPFIGRVSEALKEKGLIKYDSIPLTLNDLEGIIKDSKHE